ncbi:MAG: hypothetical protein AB7F37_23525, partial [Variibacter sp.]
MCGATMRSLPSTLRQCFRFCFCMTILSLGDAGGRRRSRSDRDSAAYALTGAGRAVSIAAPLGRRARPSRSPGARILS